MNFNVVAIPNSKNIFQGLKDANRVVERALQESDFKITFKTDWTAGSDLAVVTFSATSFANEAEFKSQQGRIHYITSGNDVPVSTNFTWLGLDRRP